MQWLELTARVFVSYLVLLVMTRLMGKKQLSQLTFFNYVTGITIGSMAASLATDDELQFEHGIYGIILWAALTVMMEYLTLKSIRIRFWTDGRPTVLIKQGQIVKTALQKTRYNVDELNMMLRTMNIFNMEEVDYAVLENNGQLTVLKKVQYQNFERQDSGKSFKPNKNLPTQVINGGKINKDTLDEMGLDEKWLEFEIKKKGYKLKDIFYAAIDSSGELFIMPVNRDSYT
ncbi:MAG: DUF421 domain-containing protein [Sedimentibacter sp.]|uniref:DUF421 domain-containing protein n=1 Tax=Sedimentibacter sp. TaxID=1960295 RepID=UPI0031585861